MISKFIGLTLLLGCLSVVYLMEGQDMGTQGVFRIFHWPAIMLTSVGAGLLVFICCDWQHFFRTFFLLFSPNAIKRQKHYLKESQILNRLSNEFYQHGTAVFDQVNTKNLSSFLAKVVERLAVHMPLADIREFVEAERDHTQVQMVQSVEILGLGVRLTPSIGMLGTILGMVQLLSSINDADKIGSHMSLALLTTFFGLFFSLVVWTPLQQKVERILDVELEGYNQVIRWLDLLERRKPANYFEDTMAIASDVEQHHLPKAG